MKKTILLSAFLTCSIEGISCITCNKQIQQGIYNSTFYPNLLAMMSAFIVLALIVIILHIRGNRAQQKLLSAGIKQYTSVPLHTSALILGIGLGGFIDGILLHQILQWHEMLSAKLFPSTLEAKSINMFWDGVFHLFTWCVVVCGIIKLWHTSRQKNINRSGFLLAGGLINGWAIFNLVEGIIDHYILKLHHVYEYGFCSENWDHGFTLFSILLLLPGYLLVKRSKRDGIILPGYDNNSIH